MPNLYLDHEADAKLLDVIDQFKKNHRIDINRSQAVKFLGDQGDAYMSELRKIRNVLKTRRKNFDQLHANSVMYSDPDREEDDFKGIELEVHVMDGFMQYYRAMANTCDTCKYWGSPQGELDPDKNDCRRSTEIPECGDQTIPINGFGCFVIDGIYQSVSTSAKFGCILYEKRNNTTN
jgi:hypothetical protein